MASEIPMPSALTEEVVRDWAASLVADNGWGYAARAVLALVEAKVREGVDETCHCRNRDCECGALDNDDAIVARVLGKEAPRAV